MKDRDREKNALNYWLWLELTGEGQQQTKRNYKKQNVSSSYSQKREMTEFEKKHERILSKIYTICGVMSWVIIIFVILWACS